ncbi:MAG: HEAT repeat domain-containing protein [Candidatus Latescibacterota bacterium]|jgi:HEAT repeat protein
MSAPIKTKLDRHKSGRKSAFSTSAVLFRPPFFLLPSLCFLTSVVLLLGCDQRAAMHIADLSHPTSEVRRKAAYELVNEGYSAVDPLLTALATGSDTLRYIGAQVLGRIGSPRSAPMLLKLSRDSNTDVRKEAILALGKIHVPSLKDTLQDILQRENLAELRASAVESLTGFRDTSVVPSLCRALEDSSAVVRQSAIAALNKIWTPSTEKSIVKAMQDPDEKVRFIATQIAAIRQIQAARLPLRRALEDPSPWVRAEAARGLAQLADTAAVDALVDLLKRYEGADADAAHKALRTLTGVDYVVE